MIQVARIRQHILRWDRNLQEEDKTPSVHVEADA